VTPSAPGAGPAYSREVTFDVPAEDYARFMGRFAGPLALQLVDCVDPQPGDRALDVGCGPGTLTGLLVDRLGVPAVAAVDPSPSFVSATRSRWPGVDARLGVAERLPFPDGAFDLSLAQLVVHFMTDPVAGLREMARVTRTGGLVAACVWDHAGDTGPLAMFWRAVHDVDPDAAGEGHLAGTREGHLTELCQAAGLHDVEPLTLTVGVSFATFTEWWAPFALGVGPAGSYVVGLEERRRG
jgi:SAM-dependent methyltransferase